MNYSTVVCKCNSFFATGRAEHTCRTMDWSESESEACCFVRRSSARRRCVDGGPSQLACWGARHLPAGVGVGVGDGVAVGVGASCRGESCARECWLLSLLASGCEGFWWVGVAALEFEARTGCIHCRLLPGSTGKCACNCACLYWCQPYCFSECCIRVQR